MASRMRSNFYETFTEGATKPPSERSTGFVFVAVAVLIAILRRHNPTVLISASCVAGLLAVVSLFAPKLLKPLNLLWFRFSLVLHRVVNPIVMFTIFAVVFVPAGLLMRFFRDPLKARRDLEASTYWIARMEDDGAGSMRHQF